MRIKGSPRRPPPRATSTTPVGETKAAPRGEDDGQTRVIVPPPAPTASQTTDVEPGELPEEDSYQKAIDLAKEVFDKQVETAKGINQNYANIVDEGLR